MTRAPSPLCEPALWDWLRDESLEYRDSFGQYPACKTEDDLISAVQAFTKMTMIPGTSQVTFKNGTCTIYGDFIERWCPVGGDGIQDLTVRIRGSPFLGEIYITSSTPPMLLLYTNVFVTQFTADWGLVRN